MSGHSKWSTIKRKKGAADASRGNLFSKLSKEIIIATKQGGDIPENNPRLRVAIAKARAFNMPNQNIQRVIKRASGEEKDTQMHELVYEGFGPGGYALIVKCATDNKNRTNSDIKHLFIKFGANLGKQGSNAPFFSHYALVELKVSESELEATLNSVIESGADDYNYNDGILQVLVEPQHSSEFLEKLHNTQGLEPTSFDMQYIAHEETVLEAEQYRKAMLFVNALEEYDDVQGVYTNFAPEQSENDLS